MDGEDSSGDRQWNGIHDEIHRGTEETPDEKNGNLVNSALIVFIGEFVDRFDCWAQGDTRKIECQQDENFVESMVKTGVLIQEEKEDGGGIEDTVTDQTQDDVFHSSTSGMAENVLVLFRFDRLVFDEDLEEMQGEFNGKGSEGDQNDVDRMFEKEEIGHQFAEFDGDRAQGLKVKEWTDRRNIGEETDDDQNEEKSSFFKSILDRFFFDDQIDDDLFD